MRAVVLLAATLACVSAPTPLLLARPDASVDGGSQGAFPPALAVGAVVHGFQLMAKLAAIPSTPAAALAPVVSLQLPGAPMSLPLPPGSATSPAVRQARWDGGVVARNAPETGAHAPLYIPVLEALDGVLWPPGDPLTGGYSARHATSAPPLFHLRGRLGHGAQGDVWRAAALDSAGRPDLSTPYVLKRLFAAKPAALLSGVREAFLGAKLAELEAGEGACLLARFHTHFERLVRLQPQGRAPPPRARARTPPSTAVVPIADATAYAHSVALALAEAPPAAAAAAGLLPPPAGAEAALLPALLQLAGGEHLAGGGEGAARGTLPPQALELWLVFRDEGVSLATLLHAPQGVGLAPQRPGPLWHRLATAPPKEAARRVAGLAAQLLGALMHLHAAGVSHRDVKPGNIFIAAAEPGGDAVPCSDGLEGARAAAGVSLRLGDLGSALDVSLARTALFAPPGPGEWDLTLPYAPPEALAGAGYVAWAACAAAAAGSGRVVCGDPARAHWPVRVAGDGVEGAPSWPLGATDAWAAGVTLLQLVTAAEPGETLLPPPPRARAVLELALDSALAPLQTALGESELRWLRRKAGLLLGWTAACLVGEDTLQPLLERCRTAGLHPPVSAPTPRRGEGDAAAAVRLRAAGACAVAGALQRALGGAPHCTSGGGALRALRAAVWRQRCAQGLLAGGRRHTEEAAARQRRRARGECAALPLAAAARPAPLLGAAGEAAVLALLREAPEGRVQGLREAARLWQVALGA